MKIKPKSLTEIIKGTNIKKIDFMSLDVEGHEYNVLKSWDFSIPIELILIEALGGSKLEEEKKIHELLEKNNYVFKCDYKHNKVYILKHDEKEQ